MTEYSYVEKPFLDQLAALGWETFGSEPRSSTASQERRHFNG